MENQLLYKIALTQIPMVGPKLARNLVAYCGSAEAIFKERKTHLSKIPGIGNIIANSVYSFDDFSIAEKEVAFIEKNKINALFYLDNNYPERMRDIEDAPIMIYGKGNFVLNLPKVIGIVGTRKATNYGKAWCNQLIQDLIPYKPLIVSGLAYGVDYTAHKAAVQNKLPTVGVLGHGLDTLYPSSHRNLALEMIADGGLLTEYISGTPPDKQNFPQRNRIIAGLIDALIVVETGERGGALITAEIANSYNRDVFALPGRVDDVLSSGCNKLIKQNKASLIECASDIAYNLGWDILKTSLIDKSKIINELELNHQEIYQLIKKNDKTHIDQMMAVSGKTASDLSVALLELEFKGLIHCLPGKFYKIS